MSRISVIVPVYCAEKYIKRCVDSIICQTEKDLEIILVDDGSTDSSGLICDEYARLDSRVKVIHQKNSGVSMARNAGIEIATGRYIGFVDADDWIDKEMYQVLLDEADITGADIVMCDATTVYPNGKREVDTITQLSKNSNLKKSDFSPKLLLEMAGSACRCIYKNKRCDKTICDDSLNFSFPSGIKLSEDRIFNIYAFGYANSIIYLKQSYYNRSINITSAVHRFHSDYFLNIKEAYYGTQKALDIAWSDFDEYKIAYLGQFIGGAFSAINNYFYKTCHWGIRKRIKSVKQLCDDEDLRNAIILSGNISGRAKWIINRNILMLCLYSILANKKITDKIYKIIKIYF